MPSCGVELRRDRVAAPHQRQVARRHLPRVRSGEAADPGSPPSDRNRGADGAVTARVAHHVGQPVQAVAADRPHSPSGVDWPRRLSTVPGYGLGKGDDDLVQHPVPTDASEPAAAFRAGAHHRVYQPLRVVDAISVAFDLRR